VLAVILSATLFETLRRRRARDSQAKA
jgi:hypothetical protein